MDNKLLAGGEIDKGGGITNPLFGDMYTSLVTRPTGGESFLQLLLPKVVGILLVFGGVAFFFMFLWGAITWIVSGGDKASVENAKGRITNAIIGLVLMVGVFAIAKLIEGFFGIDILSIDIGPLVIQ
ncbi:MAG: hypothetical protein QY322_03175 [bacterium]|nr:MAG: hypothetical protein QY322_03175 [bacterium]